MTLTDTENDLFKILLVEDDDDHANLIKRGFRKAKITTELERFSDGSEAIAFFEALDECEPVKLVEQLPRVILLDLNLPKISGIELLKFIRSCKSPYIRNLVVIILSTSDAPNDLRNAYSAGANSYLKKPVNFDEFKSMTETLSLYWGGLNRPALD